MAGIFLVIFILSFVVALVCRFVFPNRFNNLETSAIFGVSVLFGALMILIVAWSSMSDFDILNGQITGKKMHRVSCSHSYSCNCYRDRKGNEHCSMCYEHPYDQDWDVYSTVGGFTIDRVDRQGLIEPKRWTQIQVDDPASRKESVVNYILASPNSLFNTKELTNDSKTYGKLFPKYNHIYDYYKFDHVINMGVPLKENQEYNNDIANALKVLGATKQVNINIIFVPTSDRNYKDALERYWLGGKKNDVNVVIGITNYPTIAFADAFAFARSTHNEMLAIKLQQDIEAVGNVSKVNDIVNVITTDVAKYFNRDSMSNYKYLKEDYVPSTESLIWCSIFYLLILVGMIVFFWINDVTLDGISTNRFRQFDNSRYKMYSDSVLRYRNK